MLIQVGEEQALVQIRHFFQGFSITGQTKQLLEGDIFEQVGVHQKSKAEEILPTSSTMAQWRRYGGPWRGQAPPKLWGVVTIL